MQWLEQACPFAGCGAVFRVPASFHGRSLVCPACRRALTVIDPGAREGWALERLRGALSTRPAQRPVVPRQGRMERDFVALLENVRSLWNVGSIFRTADGAGVDHLYLTGITGRPPRPEIAKTALGAEDVVDWSYAEDALLQARALMEGGVRLLALETGPESRPIAQAVVRGPICLMVGHEVAGLSGELLELADQRLALPMHGVKESLNVAVAFGVAAYELNRRRGARVGIAAAPQEER